MESTAIVVIGGSPPDPRVLQHLPGERFVIAADSGLDHAFGLGLTVDLVVGDLDSVSADALARAERAGTPIERYPAAKDATDTELAIDAAMLRGTERLVVVAGGGDRLDHLLGSILLLADARRRAIPVEAWIGEAHLVALLGPDGVDLDGRAGELLSLLPVHGAATGVVTAGLRFPLRGETLGPATTRGISNEFVGGPARVSLDDGALLVVRPHALGSPS